MFASKDLFFTKPSGGYQISRSVRTRSSASAYFNRTFTTPTSTTIWTWSAWVKRGLLTGTYRLFGASTTTYLTFNSSDQLNLTLNGTSAATSTAVFRDPSAWYHIVYQQNGSAQTIYVNNVSVATGTTAASIFNTAISHQIAAANTTNFFDGYLTEINFIDGQALTPSSFGSTNSVTGVWQPIKYAGTYGTNGFYLNFSDNSAATAAAIGKDYSGNANNWTPNNISVTAGVTYDSMLDVPTLYADGGNGRGNYATMNPLFVGPYASLSRGSSRITATSSTNSSASYSTIGVTTGKWYFEITNSGSGYDASHFAYAMVADVLNAQSLLQAAFAGYRTDGSTNGGVSSTFATWAAGGEIIGVAIDCDNGAVYFARNNTWINSGNPTSGASRTGAITTYTGGSKTLFGGGGAYQDSSQFVDLNFGQRPFTYTPPSGFVALNTQNLPTPTISNGANYMAATTYTGTGSSLTIANTVNGISFYPDFVWVKGRSGATDHALYDSVRGTTKDLASNTTAAETTQATGLTAFSSTGFTVGALAKMNTNAATYVGWQWLANAGSSSSNTNGTITSTVSAGATQGFSVVTYTGNGTAGATVGHGLGVAPSMIIVKCRSNAATNWATWQTTLLGSEYLYLNSTAAKGTGNTSLWNGTVPSSTVITVGTDNDTNANTRTYVAYAFSAVAGYSAFGSYTGNASTDGPFVYCGFRPRFVMFKSLSGPRNWAILDSGRNTSNVANFDLYPNQSLAEITQSTVDFLSNGFKLRVTDSDFNAAETYIYMAFAENPFKLSLAR